MKLADDVADGARRFLRLRIRTESELRHRVNDAALHGFEFISDVRKRAVEDDVHRIVEVRLPREVAHGLMFDLGDGRRRRSEGSLFFRFACGHDVGVSQQLLASSVPTTDDLRAVFRRRIKEALEDLRMPSEQIF